MNDRPLLKDPSFWGITISQFLGAFNDNLFKQIVLFLSIPVVAMSTIPAPKIGNVADADTVVQETKLAPEVTKDKVPKTAKEPLKQAVNSERVISDDLQGWATAVFALPFVLFSGFAGWLSDRYSKRRVIVISKAAEIVIMLMGMIGFLYYGLWGAAGIWTVLFLMGTQASFFGPGKYGVLPELFAEKDLAKANGLIIMTTFLAIIFGIVAAGFMFDSLLGTGTETGIEVDASGTINAKPLWIGSMVCIGISVVGTWTATWIRQTAPAQPNAVLTRNEIGVSTEVVRMLRKDLPVLRVAGIMRILDGSRNRGTYRQSIRHRSTRRRSIQDKLAGRRDRTGNHDRFTTHRSGLQTRYSSYASHPRIERYVLVIPSAGLLERRRQSLAWVLGQFCRFDHRRTFAAIYAVPIQVFLQQRPPAEMKGRMIGTMNQANFVGILLSGFLYQLFEKTATYMQTPISSIFGCSP